MTQTGRPNAPAKCATAVSTLNTTSRWCTSAAVSAKFRIAPGYAVTPAAIRAASSSPVQSACRLIHSYWGLRQINANMTSSGMALCLLIQVSLRPDQQKPTRNRRFGPSRSNQVLANLSSALR